MSKFGFLILHYETIDDTTSCVKSIRQHIKSHDYDIVIVDNGSTNGTGSKIKSMYEHENDISVLLEKENLGFARGNNVGFKFCKYEKKCDYIIMINSDIEIIQDDFLERIEEEYRNSNFAVLGPKIILADDTINPVVKRMRTAKQIKSEIYKNYCKLFLNYLHLESIVDIVKHDLKNNVNVDTDVDERLENIVLHGCCLIFSKQYINKFDGIDDRTFLYHEEELLYERLRKNDMINVYNPDLKIYHKEYGSTKHVGKTKNGTKRFRYKNIIRSGKILYKELKTK